MLQNSKRNKLSLLTAWLLTAVMLLQLVPALGVFAAETVQSGTDGNISWVLDSDGVLTLSGTGEMNDYTDSAAPWKSLSFSRAVVDEGVTSIGGSAFCECASLTSVSLPESLTYIGDSAFSYCPLLTSITVTKKVETVGANAFTFCPKLESVSVDEANPYYASVDGVLYTKDMTQLVACPGAKASVSVPEGVETVGVSAFNGCSALTDLTLPETLTAIANWGFGFCESLTSVTLPDSVVTLGWYAFSGCASLETVTFPKGIAAIRSSAFAGCDALKKVYYYGTEAEWNEIGIGSSNDCLVNASIVFRPALDATAAGYTVSDGLVTGVSASTTASALVASFANGSSVIKVLSADGTAIADSDLVGTGASIQVSDNEGTLYQTATVIIKGDCTGDGLTDSTDVAAVRNAIKSRSELGDSFEKAVDSNGDGLVNSLDYIRLKLSLKQ